MRVRLGRLHSSESDRTLAVPSRACVCKYDGRSWAPMTSQWPKLAREPVVGWLAGRKRPESGDTLCAVCCARLASVRRRSQPLAIETNLVCALVGWLDFQQSAGAAGSLKPLIDSRSGGAQAEPALGTWKRFAPPPARWRKQLNLPLAASVVLANLCAPTWCSARCFSIRRRARHARVAVRASLRGMTVRAVRWRHSSLVVAAAASAASHCGSRSIALALQSSSVV